MNVQTILQTLRREREQLDEAIFALERLSTQGRGRGPGRPPGAGRRGGRRGPGRPPVNGRRKRRFLGNGRRKRRGAGRRGGGRPPASEAST